MSDKRRAVTYVARGEIAFLLLIAICVALHPGFVLKRNEGGMSNYGLHIKTAVPYTLALLALTVSSRRAARLYTDHDKRSRRLRSLLFTYSAVVFSVLLSTYFYSQNIELKDLHFALGTALIVLVGVGSIWLYRQFRPSIGVRLLLIVQLIGDLLTLLSATGTLRALFVAEMLSNIGFAVLLIRTGWRVAVEDSRSVSYESTS
jgi:hypothetical protein